MRNPERIGPFRVVERINPGGAGITYLAVRDGQPSSPIVCVKTPHPMHARDSPYLATFETEARFARLLRHPHIVALLDVGVDHTDGRRYLAYALIEGLDLAEMIRSYRKASEQIEWYVVATLAVQLTHALEYAHTPELGEGVYEKRPAIIHRDICPANILLGLSGGCYLTDFGIARALETPSLRPSLAASGRTAYCAPERLVGRAYDARADLFSLGVTLFEALTNRQPFCASSITEHLQRVLERPRIEPLRVEFHLSHRPPPDGLVQLVEAVHRLLEPDPAARYQSAVELADALGCIRVPAYAPRDLAKAVRRHMPRWRRRVRPRTGETAHPSGVEPTLWSHTNPKHLAPHLKGPNLCFPEQTFDPKRDCIWVTAAGAQRLLASRHTLDETSLLDTTDGDREASSNTAFNNTAPMGSGHPFDATTPDRPVSEHEHSPATLAATHEHEKGEPDPVILTPPPIVDALPDIPVTHQRPVSDPTASSEPEPTAVQPPKPTPPPPRHAAQAHLGLPALRVNTAGDLAAIDPSRAGPPTAAPPLRPVPASVPPIAARPAPSRSSALRLLLIGAFLLGLAGACGLAALGGILLRI